MNNRIIIVFSIALLVLNIAPLVLLAQKPAITSTEQKQLRKKEDTLQDFSLKMVFAEEAADRFRSDSNFVRTFVRALKVTNSFYYSFDSVNISKLYAPDSAFRIFTWQMKKDEYVYLQQGAIQMNTPDGSLKLYPLFDYSMYTPKPLDSVRSRNNWIGAIYYRIIGKEYNGQKYYTLLGFDDFTVNSNKKWMEVLHFNQNGEPVFGGPFFSFKNDTARRPVQARFSVEYKKEAKTFMNYDPELDMIVFDHLIPENDEPEKKFTYIPDGDFEGFKWQNGQWVHVDKVFNFKLADKEFPKDATIYDDAGNANEQQLEAQSRKNIEKAKADQQKQPAKKNDPPKKGGGN